MPPTDSLKYGTEIDRLACHPVAHPSLKIRCQSFILKVLKYTWVRCPQDPDSFYTRFALMDLLDLLAMHRDGLECADVVAMFSTIHLWWAEDPSVPKFINKFDNSQNKATGASLPITDNWLSAMATFFLLSVKSFPNDCPSWDGLTPSV